MHCVEVRFGKASPQNVIAHSASFAAEDVGGVEPPQDAERSLRSFELNDLPSNTKEYILFSLLLKPLADLV